METRLEKRFPVSADADRAWRVLGDVSAVAGCMPGAAITEQLSDKRYRGTVTVKVGPANANFSGEIEIREMVPAERRIRFDARGADKGGSSASMDLTASIEPAADGTCVLVGTSVVIVNGKFAQFGGRLLNQVSDVILGQFARNFSAAAAGLPPLGAPQAPDSTGAAVAAPQQTQALHASAVMGGVDKDWLGGLCGKCA